MPVETTGFEKVDVFIEGIEGGIDGFTACAEMITEGGLGEDVGAVTVGGWEIVLTELVYKVKVKVGRKWALVLGWLLGGGGKDFVVHGFYGGGLEPDGDASGTVVGTGIRDA